MMNDIAMFEEIDLAALETVSGGRGRCCPAKPAPQKPDYVGFDGSLSLVEKHGGQHLDPETFLQQLGHGFSGSAFVDTKDYTFQFSGRTI